MKSIMEEASSISKAIDQAWHRAGKPTEFTIKILELPERNLFGITTKSAKVAFFFDEQQMIKIALPIEKTIEKIVIPVKTEPHPSIQQSRWNEPMVKVVKDWVHQILQIMGLPNITFTTSTSTNGITFKFKTSITNNELKDRLLFSSFAHLMLMALRQKYKRPFKNLKIILITE
jgi:predicted RNA-binding protein Jag